MRDFWLLVVLMTSSFFAYGEDEVTFSMLTKRVERASTYSSISDQSWLSASQKATFETVCQRVKENKIVSLLDIVAAIDRAKKVNGKKIVQGPWIDNDGLAQDFFTQNVPKSNPLNYDTHQGFYQPFTKTVVLQPGEKIKIFGDLHGGIHSLIGALKTYINQGSFKINDPKLHIAFLGNVARIVQK